MKFHAFSPRASAAAVGIAVLLICGNAAGAMAAVASTPAPVAPQVTTSATATAEPGAPVPPGAPTGLTAVPGNGTVTLSWSAPSSDGGAPVDGYWIAGGTSPSSTSITDRVRGTTVTMSHLANGTTYFFRVSAENFTGDGPAVTVTVVIPPGPGSGSGSAPGAPAGLKVSSGDGFVALSWSPPASTGGSPVTGYHVYLGLSKSLVGARQFTTSGTSFRFTDAENGNLYYVKVTALNATGEGPGTPETSVFVAPHATASPSGPSRPTGLTAQARRGEVILSWSPPPGGLKDGQGYLIYMGTSPGHEGAKPSVPYLIQFTTHYTVAPLKDGTRYYFQVALLDRDDQMSARSAEVSAVPGVGAGAAPGPAPGVGGGARSGGKNAQPTAAPLPTAILDGQHTSSSPSAGLIILLAALSLAGTGGAIAIVLVQRRRRRHGPGYAPVPAPRRPHDDQRSRVEELNGPRYR